MRSVDQAFCKSLYLLVFRFNIPVNNFLVMLGQSRHFLGINLYLKELMCLVWISNQGPLDPEFNALAPGHRRPYGALCGYGTRDLLIQSSML